MTKLRNTCLFYIAIVVVAPLVFVGINELFHNFIIAIVVTFLVVIPFIFIETIVRFSVRKNRQRKQNFFICPRCNIAVEKEPGICSQCGIKV